MTHPNRVWTLTAAFSNAAERDKALTSTESALARSGDASSTQIYRTEMTDGRPALGLEHADRATLARMLSPIASLYHIVSISMYLGS